jgi:hypothetical protein
VAVNVVVLAGTVAADPVVRELPSGDEVTELKLSVPEPGKRFLPLPVAAWHKSVGKRLSGHRQGGRGAGLRPGCPALLPQRAERPQRDGGGGIGDQEAGTVRRRIEGIDIRPLT